MPITIKTCKVCNSKHRALIESLAAKNMSAEKIYEYLKGLQDPIDRKIVRTEDIKPSGIRRHIQKHFNEKDANDFEAAKIKSKISQTKDNFEKGIKITIDKVNTLSFMIQTALNNIQELENNNSAKKHQYTIGYMGQIKALIDELQKVSGDLQTESVIDNNFFRTEINTFAEIVLSTIRALDIKHNMNFELEMEFSEEFKKQFRLYTERQDMIFAGKLSPRDGDKERNINRFNDSDSLV